MTLHSLRSFKNGFTLVELLIVVSIISILTGIIVTSLTSSRSKSRDAQRVSDVNQIQLALEQYFDRCGMYPQVDGTDGGPSTTSSCTAGGTTVTIGSYISKIPKDPSTQVNYGYVVSDPDYPTDYVLHATLENTNQVQQNSYPQSIYDGLSWKSGSFSCYDSSAAVSKEYCISTK